MLYALCIIIGIIAARWLVRPLAALVRAGVFVGSVLIALRVAAIVEPRFMLINWRGVGAGAALGLVFALLFFGAWFYLLGWRGRVAQTEQDEIERARQKASKDRQVV
jgi:hypothetical protein